MKKHVIWSNEYDVIESIADLEEWAKGGCS